MSDEDVADEDMEAERNPAVSAIDVGRMATTFHTPLSSRAWSIWAKSDGVVGWLPLPQHMADSKDMAERLYEDWLSRQVRDRWEALSLSPSAIRSVAVFLAAVHDVGKASPTFLAQHSQLAERVRAAGFACPDMDELRDDRKHLPHSLISQHALVKWLIARGVGRHDALALGSVVGGHHGRPAAKGQRVEPKNRPLAVGTGLWDELREELLTWAAAETGFDRLVEDGESLSLPLPVLVELTGFVIVADWLASNTSLYPLRSFDAEGEPEPDDDRSEFAWDEIGMPPAWEPPESALEPADFFRARFGWPDTATPRKVQEVAVEVARGADVGISFIEATTGEGKTEAALAMAEVIASRRGSQGILVALPTQATTNAMFSRVADWVERQPAPPPEVGAWAFTLGHGKARLNPTYAALEEEFAEFNRRDAGRRARFQSAGIHEEDAAGQPGVLCNAVVHQWFLSAKRRLLANFSVVTIDQLLMAALQRKHLMLAHVALSGKVVIIDEAHASDEYMNVYLDSVLSWLAAYRVPVVVLSATLTTERRKSMMRAYASHRSDEIDATPFDPEAYPLITVVPDGPSPIQQHVVPLSGTGRRVTWQWHPTDVGMLCDSVQRSVADGGCALVIRNTVRDAQETAMALAATGIPVLLNHAAFLAADRALNDQELCGLFGKDGARRPDQCIVVATQVAEQSLDIDFDVLFSDLAPMDLIFQRIGRLHRHSRRRPDTHEVARLYLLADDPGAGGPPAPSRGSEFVYGRHHLLRTAAALLEHGSHIELPSDVSPLVQRALGGESLGRADWADDMAAAAKQFERTLEAQRAKASAWCVRPWAAERDRRRHLGDWLATSNDFTEIQMGATVRDTEPSLEVLVVPVTPGGAAAIRPPWMVSDEAVRETLDTSSRPSDDLAREIATWSVRLPALMTRGPMFERVIEALDRNPATRRWAWRQHRLLKGELFLALEQAEEGSTSLSSTINVSEVRFDVKYSQERGLEVVKNELQPAG